MSNGPPRPPPRRWQRLDSPSPVSDVKELRSAPVRQPTLAEVAGRVEEVNGLVQYVRTEMHTEMKGLRGDLSALSKFVMGDQAARLTAVEQRTPAQKVSAAACWAGKGTAYATLIAVGARMLGKAFPQFDGAITDLLKALGL